MINAEHYCKFVKVNGLLSPVSEIQLQKLQVSSLIVSAALSWRLRVTPPHVYHRDAPRRSARGLLRCWAACWRRCHNALHVASRKIRETASVTHAWQSVITGALYCVFTLKVVQVSICLGARQCCTHRQHIQAASLVNVSSALACLTEKEHFFPLQQCRISSFPYAVSAVFSLPIVLKSPFIFKLAPSKILLSGDY